MAELAGSLVRSVTISTEEPVSGFRRAYSAYYAYVRGALRGMNVSEADVDDVTQEVFVVLLRKVQGLGDPERLRPWLFQTARRVAGNHRRGRSRARRREEAVSPTTAALDLEDQVALREAAERVVAFLEGLDSDNRRLFVGVEVEGRATPDVAAELGLNLNTAYSRIRALRRRFGENVGERERSWALLPVFGIFGRRGTAAHSVAGWGAAGAVVVAIIAILLALLSGRGPSPSSSGSPPVAAHEPGDDDPDVEVAGAALTLPPGTGVVTGQVIEQPSGRVVPDATVCALSRGTLVVPDMMPWFTPTEAEPAVCVTSTEEGFTIHGVPFGRVHVYASHEDLVGAGDPVSLRLSAGREAPVRLPMRAGGVVMTGQVEDAFGGAVQDATVSVLGGPTVRQVPVAGTRTDAEGRFSVRVAEPRNAVHVHAPGYSSEQFSVNVDAGLATLKLHPESVIDGIVVDASGAAATGAQVYAEPAGRPGLQAGLPQPKAVQADGGGRFELRQLPPGEYRIFAYADAGAGRSDIVQLEVGTLETDVRVAVAPTVSIRGRVVDEEGRACPNPLVRGQDLDIGGGYFAPGNPDGTVELRWVPQDAVLGVTVDCPGHVLGYFERVMPGEPGEAPRTWTVSAGRTLTGRVQTATGKPVGNWQVFADPKAGGPQDAFGKVRLQTIRTDDRGQFVMPGLAEGEYWVRAVGQGHAVPAAMSVAVAEHNDPLVIEVPETCSLTGTVSTDGAPVQGARVTVAAPQTKAPAPHTEEYVRAVSRRHEATTRPDGSFLLPAIPCGEYQVWADLLAPQRGYSPAWMRHLRPLPGGPALRTVALDGSRTTVDLELPSTPGLHGVVEYDGGEPAEHVLVDVARVGVPGPVTQVRTGDDGSFRVPHLPPGRYRLSATNATGVSAVSGELRPGTDAVRLTLEDGGTIRGQVLDGTGQPLDRYRVHVVDEDRGTIRMLLITDPNGAFELEGIPYGTHRLEVSADGRETETRVTLSPETRVVAPVVRLAAPVARAAG